MYRKIRFRKRKNKVVPNVIAIEEKDTWTGNGRRGDLGCGEIVIAYNDA
jgi:DNA-binding protein H-NS